MLDQIRHWSLVATTAALTLRERTRREEGQALVEYALILFLIAVVCIAVLTALGTGVRNTLQSVVNAI
jgi:pilus assembly protein Flp/PilA